MPKVKELILSTTDSSNYVTQLTEAEKKASEIIDSARKRKALRMKRAKEEALAEIDKVKQECEDKMQFLLKSHSNNNDSLAIQYQTNLVNTIKDLNSSFKANRADALKFIIEKACDIQVEPHKNY